MPALLVPVAPALADEKVTNFNETADSAFVVGHTFNDKREAAISFTTGSNALGYDLKSVKLKFGNKQGSPKSIEVRLHANVSNQPGEVIKVLSGTVTSPANQDATFTLTPAQRLDPNKTYHIALSTQDTSSPNIYNVSRTSSTNERKPDNNDTGWSIGNKGSTRKTGGGWRSLSWYTPLFLSVDADNVVASLEASNITTTGATLTISGRDSDSWYYKADKAPYNSCSDEVSSGTTTDGLTGLRAGTDYTFKAYSDSSCNTELTTDTSDAEFTTNAAPTLTASNVTDTTATLTLANVSGNAYWFAKYTSPSGGTCPNAATSWADNVTGLSANTSYTFKAYSDNSCNTEHTTDTTDAEFTTKLAKVTNLTVAARDSSLAVSWTAVTDATSYKIQWKSGSEDWDADNRQATVNSGTTTTRTITGLTNSTQYTVRVAAASANNDGVWSATATGTPADETLTVSGISVTGATLTIANYGGIWYYKYTTPNGGSCSSAGSAAAATVSNLEGGTTYTFKAYSNSSCSTELATASNFTTGLAQVTGVTVEARDQSLAVSWKAVTGAASYKVQWKSVSEEFATSRQRGVSAPATSTTIPASGSFANSTPYMVRVAAVKLGGVGDGAWSATVTGTPTDKTLTVSGISATGATLTIGNYSSSWYYTYTTPSGGSCSTTAVSGTSVVLSNLSASTAYTFKAYSDSGCTTELATAPTFRTAAASSSATTPTTSPVSFPPAQTGNDSGQTGPNGVPVYDLPEQQTATEGVTFPLRLPSATSGSQTINYKLKAYVEADGDGNWRRYEGLVCSDPKIRPVNCTVVDDNPPEEVLVVLTATVGSGASASSTSISFLLKIEAVNDAPRFEAIGAQTAIAGEAFSLTVSATDPEGDPITSYHAALQQEDGRLVAPGEPGWPGWLAFDADARTFTGTPKAADAPTAFTIAVIASDGEDEGTATFPLKVEAKTNSRLPEVSRQWLARFGRTVSSQVVDSIAGRLGADDSANSIVLGGYALDLGGESPVVSDSDRSSSSVAHGHHNHGTHSTHGDPFAADSFTTDPFAPLLPSTRERLNNQSIATSPTSRELLTGSSFRLSLNPGASRPSTTTMATATTQDGSSGASGSVGSATTTPGGWTVWGEAAYDRFDAQADDLSVEGGVLTGVAALDWEQDQWLLGMAVSRSEGNGEFSAPATAGDEAVAGTVSSSLTALYPYARVRPQPGVELWGAAGYGRGTMTVEAEDGSGAKPDVWLTMAAIGGRGSLLTAEQTGGPALDLTADALFTRTGAEAAGSLRDAVDAATTRLRMGVESSWNVQNADGTSVVPTLSAALRYDAGDAETGLGMELGSGLTFTSPGSGISFSAEVRGLLSNQDGEDGIGLREWGASGSIRYDRDADDLGLTAALSPSWGVTGSRADQLWSEATLPFTTDGDSASNGTGRLDGEVGYGFAAFNGNGIITPYGGLGLADGSRHWRIGSRFSLSSGLDLLIEGSRNEQQREAPDHGIHINLNTVW